MHEDTTYGFGFLTEVPFFKSSSTSCTTGSAGFNLGQNIFLMRNFEANLVDESVIYACCETSARLVEAQDELIPSYLKGGPLEGKCQFGSNARFRIARIAFESFKQRRIFD